MTRLVEAIGTEVARLREHRATIDVGQLAENRADAIALSTLDPGKEGALAQRYIAAASRDLSRALRDLHLVESRHGSDPDAEPEPEPAPDPIAEPDPSPEKSPDLVVQEEVVVPLASFGELALVAAPAAPAVAPAAPTHALQPARAAVSVAFCPPLRR